jgi:hypothetical protein
MLNRSLAINFMLCYEGQEDSYHSISTIFIKKQYLILFYHVWRRIYILTPFILILLYIYIWTLYIYIYIYIYIICLEKNQTNEGKERKTKMFIFYLFILCFLRNIDSSRRFLSRIFLLPYSQRKLSLRRFRSVVVGF